MANAHISDRGVPEHRIDPTNPKYRGGRAGYRALNALLYLGLARQAANAGDTERACLGYHCSLETWGHANEVTRGRWHLEQDLTNREYAAFLLGNAPEV